MGFKYFRLIKKNEILIQINGVSKQGFSQALGFLVEEVPYVEVKDSQIVLVLEAAVPLQNLLVLAFQYNFVIVNGLFKVGELETFEFLVILKQELPQEHFLEHSKK